MKSVSFISTLLGLASADQPVSCLRTHIHEQVWNFYVSADVQTHSLFESKELCTHQLPNKIQLLGHNHPFSFTTFDVWQVMIHPDFTATANFCPNGDLTKCDKQKVNGHWQNYYDQAITLWLDPDLRFMTNFRYELKQNVTKDPLGKDVNYKKISKSIEKESKENFDSVCDSTMVGFVQQTSKPQTMAEQEITCFFAEKDKTRLYENQVMVQKKKKVNKHEGEDLVLKLAQTTIPESTKMRATGKRPSLYRSHEPSEETDLQIESINAQNLTWKANECMLTKTHAKYDKAKCDGGSKQSPSLTQVEKNKWKELSKDKKTYAKSKLSGQKKFGEDTQEFRDSVEHAQSFGKKYQSIEDMPDSMVPEKWDFRNIKGYDYTGELRDQGACGSCFTMGFVQTIEARMKLKYAQQAKKLEPISPQQIMTCNYLNEGCEGGWAILNGFFGENAHFVSEKCAPYKEKTKKQHCSNYEHCEPLAKIEKSYYINGYNFKPTVQMIQKEMLLNGPVVTEFKCDDNFGYYKEGILVQNDKAIDDVALETDVMHVPSEGEASFVQIKNKETPEAAGNQSIIQTKSSSKLKMATQELNHTIFLVGWGKDEASGMPYWIVRNSYGDSWGMDGDFHVKMGNDDFGIESEISGYDVKLLA